MDRCLSGSQVSPRVRNVPQLSMNAWYIGLHRQLLGRKAEAASADGLNCEIEEHTKMKMCPEQNMKLLGNSQLLSKHWPSSRHFHYYTTAEQGLRRYTFCTSMSISNPHFHFNSEHIFSLIEVYILHVIIRPNNDLRCVVISQIPVTLIDLSGLFVTVKMRLFFSPSGYDSLILC